MQLRDSQISWQRAGDEIIVLDLVSGGEYFALNASAALLWEQVADAPRSREQLSELLRQTYGLTTEQADADVDAFLAMLRQHELVRE